MSIKELVRCYSTSRSTINRVLEERGLATPIPRLKGEAYRVMKTLEAFGIEPDALESALNTAALNMKSIQLFINQCSNLELPKLICNTSLDRLMNRNDQENVKPTTPPYPRSINWKNQHVPTCYE